MRFAQPWWLAGTALAVVVAALLVLGGILLVRAARRFGDEPMVATLVTERAAGRRAFKGVLLVATVALGFVGLSQPQYGKGTRLIPATNLDVVIVLDYSKSMYARDVTPSRIARAKVEVSRLISRLPGARFGAVAFAGEPVSFPLTSDGGAIAQFFRQLTPNDMPVGGTAIARALEAGRELFRRDPLSEKHQKVLLLVTDGEDLEGDPVQTARAAAQAGILIHVVQIGGRTPEPIPDIDETGELVGWRTDSRGQPLTTQLTAEGEAQLGEIALATGGTIIRSQQGDTGIREVTESMRRMMTEELAERVETVYADVYMYPVGLAILLLLLETFVPEARSRRRRSASVDDEAVARGATVRRGRHLSGGLLVLLLFGCEGLTDDLFVRHSPVVDEAVALLETEDPEKAAELLQDYLSTGRCEEGSIGSPESVRQLPFASFDLGLALFAIGERFGGRFGEDEPGGRPDPREQELVLRRGHEVECALKIVRVVGAERTIPLELRARAHYLAGNLEFLRRDYRSAVKGYEAALELVPGQEADGGDTVGRDAAWNRAIALRRIEEEEKSQPDAGAPDEPDGGRESQDGGEPERPDAGDDGEDGGDQRSDAGSEGERSSGGDAAKPDEPDGDTPSERSRQEEDRKQDPPEPRKPPESQASLSQDERLLDLLEQAPTVQQHAAKKAAGRTVTGMEDK